MDNEQKQNLVDLAVIIFSICLAIGISYSITWYYDQEMSAVDWYFAWFLGSLNARLVILKRKTGIK